MNRRSTPSDNSGSPGTPTRVAPLDWARAADAADMVEWEMNACLRRRRGRRFSLTGASFLAIMMYAFFWQRPVMDSVMSSETGRTIVTSPERQILPDGSIVELKAGARVTVDYAAALRRVVLDQGEAHFQVAKDASRPFVVSARGVEVRAVGTAFSVQLRPNQVEVLVTEGRVAVEAVAPVPETVKSRDSSPGRVLVEAGSRVSVDTTASIPVLPAAEPVAVDEINDRLAWRVPWLELNSTPLSDIVPAFNRHSGARLSFADPQIGRLRLSGTLRADNVTVLLQILDNSYGIGAERGPGGTIVLKGSRQASPRVP